MKRHRGRWRYSPFKACLRSSLSFPECGRTSWGSLCGPKDQGLCHPYDAAGAHSPCALQWPHAFMLAFLFALDCPKRVEERTQISQALPATQGMGVYREIYCRELAWGIVGTGRSKIHRVGWQAGADLTLTLRSEDRLKE